MRELQRLRADHASAVLAFEIENRAYFATSVSDRGDEYFDEFETLFHAVLTDEQAAEDSYYVLVDDDGSVIGRFNLYSAGEGVADLGYRVAERAAGQGVATATVRHICTVVAPGLGLHTLRAATSSANVASQRVLLNAGFVPVGEADPASLGGKRGTSYERPVEPASA